MSFWDKLTKRLSELVMLYALLLNKPLRRTWWTRRRVIVVVAVVAVLCAGSFAFVSTPFGYNLLLATPTPQPSATTALQTDLSPIATPLSTISANSPVLGGSWQAFDTLFGDNNCCDDGGWDYQGQFGATWTQAIWVGEVVDQIPDTTVRVYYVLTEPKGTTWTTSQAQAMVNQFMPPDGKLRGSKTVYLGNLVQGTEYY